MLGLTVPPGVLAIADQVPGVLAIADQVIE
jgi:hypothetical protein